jgi:ankyrin repeat protein
MKEAEIDALDVELSTPLHHAAARGSKMTISILLEYKADVYKFNREGSFSTLLAPGACQVGSSKAPPSWAPFVQLL